MKIGILVIILTLIDQIIKICMLAINPQITLSSGWGFVLEQGTRSDDNGTYILMSIIIIILIIRYITSKNSYIKNDSRIVLSFAVAGAISNVIDRIWKGYVINYIQIPYFTTINLSYIYILVTWVGMAVILTKYTISKAKEKKLKKAMEKEKEEQSKTTTEKAKEKEKQSKTATEKEKDKKSKSVTNKGKRNKKENDKKYNSK